LAKYYPSIPMLHAEMPTFDIFSAIQDETGICVKFDSMASTIGTQRKVVGAAAVYLYQSGRFGTLRESMRRDMDIMKGVIRRVIWEMV